MRQKVNWLQKVSQTDENRPAVSGSYTTCPQCNSWIWGGQKYENCPKCSHPTSDINPESSWKCIECGERIMTGKVDDCSKCGFNWTPIQISMDAPVDQLYAPGKPPYSSILQEAYDLGAKTLANLVRLSYDKLKARALYWTHHNLERFPAYNEPGKDKEKALWLQGIGGWKNTMFSLVHRLRYNLVSLPEELRRWIEYMQNEYENDNDIIDHDNERNREEQKIMAEQAKEAGELTRKSKMLGKLIWESVQKNPNLWAGWEDAKEEDAYETADDYFQAEPYKRGQFRSEIRELASKITTQKDTPVKHYFMEPDEVRAYLAQANKINFEQATNDQVADIISKGVGITGNPYFGDPSWGDQGVHPGLTSADLSSAGYHKIKAMDEFRKRIIAARGNQLELQKLHDALDEDLRKIFFRTKE